MSERIVFVTEDGRPTGRTGPKLESHTTNTELHLAFSCYIFRKRDGKFLVTQRALGKKVWPGVWTNSVCGHPGPGESLEEAILRRTSFEVGISQLKDIQLILPKYRYKTPPYNGIVENEFCPVFAACTAQEPVPNSDEVEAYQWLYWSDYLAMLKREPEKMSYWAKDQFTQLSTSETFQQYLKSL